ncbi:LysM peptidoglycan-binding domain-containing protein [Arcobacter vandammei]|uniref:LysM peptidoglycan-binding domain-containing protein n=1 Tax=Arcobacter vandammei TaxID=2782243 RepID=UPI0018E04038|nr:LysM peptidoglycan-binding domain-containing protein [Arcobacter vandammei]
MGTQTVNLEGTQYVSDIPSVYYGATSSLVSKIDPFAGNLMGKVTLPGGTVISTTINLIKDPNNPGKVIASTTLATGITYVAAGLLAEAAITEVLIGAALASIGIVASPLVISIATLGGIAVLATVGGSSLQSLIYDGLALAEHQTEVVLMSPEVTGKITQEEFIVQSVTNDPNFCKDIYPKYLNYRQIVDIKSGSTLAESIKYDSSTNEIIISNSTLENQDYYIKETLKNNDIDKAIIDETIYVKQDLSSLSSLEIRNLLSDINSVNILLSNILIKVDERLDLGEKGIYTVKSGDTFSQIANNNGLTTKELLENNTWLIDENRIKFNTPTKILVNKEANLYNNNLDHTLIGTSTDDILIDHNGGNDTFIAGAGTNYIDGGEGSDTVSYKHMINSNKEGININLSLATAQAINSTITDTLVSIENVIGSRYDDNIIGKDDSDTTLYGGAGDDTLVSTMIGFKNESVDYSKGSSY